MFEKCILQEISLQKKRVTLPIQIHISNSNHTISDCQFLVKVTLNFKKIETIIKYGERVLSEIPQQKLQ